MTDLFCRQDATCLLKNFYSKNKQSAHDLMGCFYFTTPVKCGLFAKGWKNDNHRGRFLVLWDFSRWV